MKEKTETKIFLWAVTITLAYWIFFMGVLSERNNAIAAIPVFWLIGNPPTCPDPDVAYKVGVMNGWHAATIYECEQMTDMASKIFSHEPIDTIYWDSELRTRIDSVLNISP